MTENSIRSTLLIDGYTHQMETQLNNQIIPIDIIRICFAFYYINPITAIIKQLNHELDPNRRPTITDLGDMHIIPHDYLDEMFRRPWNQLDRWGTRIDPGLTGDQLQARLLRHWPIPVAQTLAETLLVSIQPSDEVDSAEIKCEENEHYSSDDDEWQFMYVYEPMYSFIPMSTEQKHTVINKLETKLSLRPSTQQIEYLGVVPYLYFANPEQSILRQALKREIALDVLEEFFSNRSKHEKNSKMNNDLKQWMVKNSIWDHDLHQHLVFKGIVCSANIAQLQENTFDQIIRQFRVEQFVKLIDKISRNRIDKMLIKLEKAWRKIKQK